jgi:hypothetical protein
LLFVMLPDFPRTPVWRYREKALKKTASGAERDADDE